MTRFPCRAKRTREDGLGSRIDGSRLDSVKATVEKERDILLILAFDSIESSREYPAGAFEFSIGRFYRN